MCEVMRWRGSDAGHVGDDVTWVSCHGIEATCCAKAVWVRLALL